MKIEGDVQRRQPGPFSGAGLQHVEGAALDGELDVLHVLVVRFQLAPDLLQLLVALGHQLFEGDVIALGLRLRNRPRRANAGHHILALRVLQILSVEVVFTGRRIAREGHAGRAIITEIAVDHALDVDAGAQPLGDAVLFPIGQGTLVVPAAEDRGDRAPELLLRVLRERLAGVTFDHSLELADELFPVRGHEVRVLGNATRLLELVQQVVERALADFQHDVAVHLKEPSVGIEGEAPIATGTGQPFDAAVVQTQVENRVHHAGHGELGARAHRDQQRVLHVTELLASLTLHPAQGRHRLLLQVGGNLVPDREELVASSCGKGEARWHRNPEPGHLGEVCTLTAEQVFHLGVAFSLFLRERVNQLCHYDLLSACPANSRMSK